MKEKMTSKTTSGGIFHVGIDVGSTTTKIAVINPETGEVLYSDYQRHHAEQLRSVRTALLKFDEQFPDEKIRVALTGSGAKPIADAVSVPFVQEVVGNSIALKRQYGKIGTAIELGGQDAKMLFFHTDKETGESVVDDMRMNGSCAGGTGAFIDEVAAILKTPIEEFNSLAEKGTTVYDISGRCGVYAKTDIQPLLNQGISKSDLALSSFHAIAKQSIGGLAQGLDIVPPVAFEGGPLTFNPVLIRVFCERLGLGPDQIIVPEHPEIMIAYGAALSLDSLFADQRGHTYAAMLADQLSSVKEDRTSHRGSDRLTRPFFDSREEYETFKEEHRLSQITPVSYKEGDKIRAYLGIDCGSTTTKFVLMDEQENLLEQFYGPNEGDPLIVLQQALLAMRQRAREAGAEIEIIAAGSTGYGELLVNKAMNTESHMVETLAHAWAAEKYVKDVSFILDIGGQDMKAIWISNGIATNIVVNEACSSGCGSFLENFAKTLHIPVKKIAETAFSSKNPAALGSRCTVFMNSSIITEQRNGKVPGDIMAGLCRSIIENVFTKVIRISNIQSLGKNIVVQGGTFQNDAVLRAMEQYIGRTVTRAPYPGLMGAIGAALLTKEEAERAMAEGTYKKTFLSLDELENFSYTQEANIPCPFCSNHCKRTVVRFSNGNSWITNNRCERGEVLGNPKDSEVQAEIRKIQKEKAAVPNLFDLRTKLLFKEYPYTVVDRDAPEKNITIGLPRVLSNWEYMPFWTTFWKSLGFKVKMSPMSTRKIYESGLHAVTSDTVCFPAKLVHGHLRSLRDMKVDRIFMPTITTVHSENRHETSESMCAIVKGYPLVVRNSDNPEAKWGIPFDCPLFHWHSQKDMEYQLPIFIQETFGIKKSVTLKAIGQGLTAMNSFRSQMQKAGRDVLDQVTKKGTYAVVLASRPYQIDGLVNHELPGMFTSRGIPVITCDAVPGVNDVDLTNSRLDIVNNFHARMLGSAVLAAENDHLEYVQVVSFGCGHDAYLSDEIIRLMDEISGKAPLVLKLDESDIQGPLRIRVRSFIETIEMRRTRNISRTVKPSATPTPSSSPKRTRRRRLCWSPTPPTPSAKSCRPPCPGSTSRLSLFPVGRDEAISDGKKYVHNDICFPAQIVVGEIISALKSGKYQIDQIAVAMGKYIGDCRLTHYSALLRKALDDAGFPNVPILTNDDVDVHNLHPGFKMSLLSAIRLSSSLPMIDALEEILRKTSPYEIKKGSADAAFDKALSYVVNGLKKDGIQGARKGFKKAIDTMNQIKCDFSEKRPRVLIVGEYLLNFHPGANHDIEKYLENNGFEVIEARMADVIRKTYFYQNAQVKEFHIRKSLKDKMVLNIQDNSFNVAQDFVDSIAKRNPLYKPAPRMQDIVKDSDSIIHHTFDAGEGVLIPAEILHHAKEGCRNFIILQPFGCLPNHVVGRGISKKLKELYPDANILPLDYDPDVSTANIENRLQMLIMNTKMGMTHA